MGSPEGAAPEPLELQGLSAAHYHGVRGKIQQLFKYYDSVLHFHQKIQAIRVFLAHVRISGAGFFTY